jgi:hypothetical protein
LILASTEKKKVGIPLAIYKGNKEVFMPNYYDPNIKQNAALDIFGNPMGFNIPMDDSEDITPWEKTNRWSMFDTSKFTGLSLKYDDTDSSLDPWEENG